MWVGAKGGHVLLEEDGAEARVESTNTFSLCDLGEAAHEAAGESGLGNETDARCFERAERDVGKELSAGCRCEVDGSSVVGCILVAQQGDGLLLEELVAAELEGALQEVAGKSWANASEEGAGAFFCDDLAETTDQATVIGRWVELDTGFDAVEALESHANGKGESNLHIDRCEAAMGEGAADCAGKGEARVEVDTAKLRGCICIDLCGDLVDLRADLLRCRAHLDGC